MNDTLYINDLKRHTRPLSQVIKNAVNRVVDSGRYILANELTEFEDAFKKYCNISHCYGVNNGTDALEIALKALDCSYNDKVINVANAGGFSTISILNCGAIPVYVDIDPETHNIDINDLKKKLDKDIKAIIITHLYGRAANIVEIISLASEYNIPVIEDCAQAHGAEIQGKKVGTFGAIGVFSFFPTKNLGALGDAGCIITNNDEIAFKVKSLRQYGWGNKYQFKFLYGRNSRMDEIQAAILKAFLPYLDSWNGKRIAIAAQYYKLLKDIPDIHLPKVNGRNYVAHLYVIRHPNRSDLINYLISKNIVPDIHYPISDYKQEAVIKRIGHTQPLLNTELVTSQILTLPCFPEMTQSEVTRVAEAVLNFNA